MIEPPLKHDSGETPVPHLPIVPSTKQYLSEISCWEHRANEAVKPLVDQLAVAYDLHDERYLGIWRALSMAWVRGKED